MKPHKHAELIKAWADGAEIEWHCYFNNKWFDASLSPSWDNDTEFRVKPVKKWTPKYRLVVAKIDDNSSNSSYKDVSDDVKNYWKLTEFVELFETDWDNQYYEVFKDFNENYKVILCDTYPSLGIIRMSEQCAEKLCDMLNAEKIEL